MHNPTFQRLTRTSSGRHGVIFPMCSLAVLVLAGAVAAADGWQSLFNGRDLSGWTVQCKPEDRGRNWWRVEDQTIVGDSMGAGKHDYIWLVTEREFSDFTLRLQFQAYHDSPGNSGVQVRSRYDSAAGWLDGPQVDIHPPEPWRTGMVWDETRGNQRWLWPVVPKGEWVTPAMARPGVTFRHADEPPGWNTLEITAAGTRLTAVLNGAQAMDYDGAGVLDDAVHRARRVGERGHIALQIHTGDQVRIRFKNIEIREPAALQR